MADLKLFIPLTKVDVEKRLVYGIATAEAEDASGEWCDYETSKPFYQEWSDEVSKNSGGKSLGNLRSMHGSIAAGKLTDLNFNDEAKQIEICAKVVDDTEWNKVVEGVYTGFSQGGSYVKRWTDTEGKQRYTAKPVEVSLVDLPCLPTATFSVIKADGSTELRKFQVKEVLMPTNGEIAERASELAKAAGSDNWGEFVLEARKQLEDEIEKAAACTAEVVKDDGDMMNAADPKKDKKAKDDVAEAAGADEVSADKAAKALDAPNMTKGLKQVWVPEEAEVGFMKKADALADLERQEAEKAVNAVTAPLDAMFAEAVAEVAKRKTPAASTIEEPKVEAATSLHKTYEKTAKEDRSFEALGFEKGMYTISRLASFISDLNYLADSVKREEAAENDTSSTLPARMNSLVSDLCDTLTAMVAEEIAELVGSGDDEDGLVDFCCSRDLSDAVFETIRKGMPQKVGDDLLVKRALAKVEIEKAEKEALAKAAPDAELAKAAEDALRLEKAKNDVLGKKLDDMAAQMVDLLKSVKEIAEAPMPLPLQGQGSVVEKDRDSGPDPIAQAVLAKRITEDSNFAAEYFIKQSYKNPRQFAGNLPQNG